MIGGLQGDFGDLDIKYLKQNISKCRSQISGSFRRTLRHCAKWLRNSLGKRYQRIRICLIEEVETPSFPIWICLPDVKHPEKVARHPDRMPDVGYPEKMERHLDRILRVGYPKKMERHPYRIPRVHGVGTHPEQLHPDSPSGHHNLEQLHPDSSSGHATLANITHPDDSISYPDTALAIITPELLAF